MLEQPFLKGRRLRVFGGPNGSGKTTIIELIKSTFDVGYYVNADDIQKELKANGAFDLEKYGLTTLSNNKFDHFIEKHSITDKAASIGFDLKLVLENSKIRSLNQTELTYESALIADFLRTELIQAGKKLTFETVMSHKSKIETIKQANQNGYKSYLYFICTSSPKINVERVNLRVKKGGHPVPEELIKKRYYNSLDLLKSAVSQTYRSFIWDNSGKKPEMILEVFNGKEVTFKTKKVPYWVDQYLLSKK